MKKYLLLIFLLLPSIALAQFTTVQGGTGTTSPSGILYGDGTLHLKTVGIGTGLTFTGGTLTGMAQSTFGTTSLSAIYPVQYSQSPLAQFSLAFGTTTQNFWNQYNNFSSLFATNASSTNATTTNLSITGAAANCNGVSALTTNSSGVVGCTAQPQGTVTAITVASANGFAGSSSGGATPSLTLSTTITGLLKGNGTAISAASNGTDYTLLTAITCTNQLLSAFTAAGVGSCSSINNAQWSGAQLTVANGGTGATIFGQGWIFSSGGTGALAASTSPTVNYITATSTTATSTFAYSINSTSGGHATNGVYLSRIATVYSTSTPGTNVSVVFTGARDSVPTFAAGASGTLTLPNNTYAINVEVIGSGGGGGGGPSSTNNGGTGGGGAVSCFETTSNACASTNVIEANGGSGGGGGFDASNGGVGGGGGPGGSVAVTGDLNFTGEGGKVGATGTSLAAGRGGGGGNAVRAGAGGAGGGNGGVQDGFAGTFGGGGGGSTGGNANNGGGSGGGAGGYVSKLIINPTGSYFYTIGLGGTGGAAGSGSGGDIGAVGGPGGTIFTIYTY